MTTWASHHFDSCCSETVFPVPKPPGIAAVPPFAIGNRKSMTRWPVMSGTLGIIRFFVGRGWRTGQSCFIVSLRPPSSSATISSTFMFPRSEEHTSELQSRFDLVCRLLLEKKKNYIYNVLL